MATDCPENSAMKRLELQLKKSKLDKATREMTKPLEDFLLKKCGEDATFAGLVLQEHKTFDKCFIHIKDVAQKKAKNGFYGMYGSEVCKTAVDYYEKDDAEEERKKAEEAEKRAQEAKERAAKRKEDEKNNPKVKTERVPEVKPPVLAENKKHTENQLSLLDLV